MANEINIFEELEEGIEAVSDLEEPQEEPEVEPAIRTQGKRVLEALLFASPSPLPFRKIQEILITIYPFSSQGVLDLIEELKNDYLLQERAYQIEEIAEGFLLRTRAEFHPYLQQLFQTKRKERLSPAALETLTIIAYKQPITRLQIEAFRGVDSSGIVQSLLERQMIETAGHLEAPGRPTLYRTTEEFLQHFGLKDLSELPSFKE